MSESEDDKDDANEYDLQGQSPHSDTQPAAYDGEQDAAGGEENTEQQRREEMREEERLRREERRASGVASVPDSNLPPAAGAEAYVAPLNMDNAPMLMSEIAALYPPETEE